ncbi:hypothetical protein BDN71DRAFT_1507013 [Pleurotus eryngii]|uniref:Uncharacterized protein n=1 Tax=Pleurotus eryngii TaxID=5323 RepID=A0A9P5ZWB4_PLEER|nr:hypothetical protein BDN71DRAFT_1507013 [Pleurotus eryngii]
MNFEIFDKQFCSKIHDLDGVYTLANALVHDHLVPVKMDNHAIYCFYLHSGAKWRFMAFSIVENTKNGSFVKATGCTNVLPITDATIARDRLALGALGPHMPQADALFKNQLQQLVEVVDRFEQNYGTTLYVLTQPGEVPSGSAVKHQLHSIREVPDYNPSELQMVQKKLGWQGLLTSDKTYIDPREIYEWLQPGIFVQMSCTLRIAIHNGHIIPVLGANEIEIELEHRSLIATPVEPREFPSTHPARGMVFDVLNNLFDVLYT